MGISLNILYDLTLSIVKQYVAYIEQSHKAYTKPKLTLSDIE
jgi:hypothetical protein